MLLKECIYFDSSDSCQSQCYCVMQHTYQRDAPQPSCCCCMPAAPLCCSSAAAVLHKCNWSGLCNHWIRLHCCTLPVLLLKLLLKCGLAWLGFVRYHVPEFPHSSATFNISLGSHIQAFSQSSYKEHWGTAPCPMQYSQMYPMPANRNLTGLTWFPIVLNYIK